MSAVFEDVPRTAPAGRYSALWRERLRLAVENPGREIRVNVPVDPTTATRLRHPDRYHMDIPAGRWTFTTRRTNAAGERAPDGKSWLYAIYHGEDES